MHFPAMILAFAASAMAILPRQATNSPPPLCPSPADDPDLKLSPSCCQTGGQSPVGCENRKSNQQNEARRETSRHCQQDFAKHFRH
jgi:hypothetical protein